MSIAATGIARACTLVAGAAEHIGEGARVATSAAGMSEPTVLERDTLLAHCDRALGALSSGESELAAASQHTTAPLDAWRVGRAQRLLQGSHRTVQLEAASVAHGNPFGLRVTFEYARTGIGWAALQAKAATRLLDGNEATQALAQTATGARALSRQLDDAAPTLDAAGQLANRLRELEHTGAQAQEMALRDARTVPEEQLLDPIATPVWGLVGSNAARESLGGAVRMLDQLPAKVQGLDREQQAARIASTLQSAKVLVSGAASHAENAAAGMPHDQLSYRKGVVPASFVDRIRNGA